MKYFFTTYKRRCIAATICLLLLLPVNLILHHLYTSWPQFATKYSYLEDPRYQEAERVDISGNGYADLQVWDTEYISTWTYFFTDQTDLSQPLRTVTLPDGTEFEIQLNTEEIEGIESFMVDGISEFGIRTSWTRFNGSWTMANTDLVTGQMDPSDPLLRQYTTRGNLRPEHLTNIQSMLTKSGESQFILHNDIVLPDGLRRVVRIKREDVDQALSDIAAGKINGLQVETNWSVKSQAIWMQHLDEDNNAERSIIKLMSLSHQDNYHDFMLSILDWIVDLQIIGNIILIMAVFIIAYTIRLQEGRRWAKQ